MGDPDEDRRSRILDAALTKFSAYGLARTSMADVAEGAGMSRPALYQYYANKDEIFRAVLQRVLARAADDAIAALDAPGSLEQQLDGFLQRWFGDLIEQLHGTEHGAELVEAKAGHAKPVADAADARVRRALAVRVGRQLDAPRNRADVVELVDLVMLSPHGFKHDAPSVAKVRRRLTALAGVVAAAVAARTHTSG